MECNNCSVKELKFVFKLTGDENLTAFSSVIQHFKRKGIHVEIKEDRFTLNESDVIDFMDFCKDHMDPSGVSFKLPNQDWKAFEELDDVLEKQWIDDVIKNEQLICYYQPIVDTDKQVFGYEILARFQDKGGSIIYPNEIFSAAKTRGRLYALDRICRMTAVRYAAPLESKKAFINFIPTSIYSPEFCLKSTNSLAIELGVNPAELVFEVVESEKVEDIDHLKKILTYYKDKGFQYALDDVGEGYSTLEMLEEIEPKYMKLDMKYVQDVATDSTKQQVAMKFLNKANEINSVPLAEGIETIEDFEWLKGVGYQLFQGYYFGKPAPNPL